jgi:hypothetical protein
MTTKRKRSQATSREGIRFVQTLVERHNCTFQEIDLQNDLGNDAYVEFVVEENATGCCIALQVKSGRSYRISQGRYSFQCDRADFEYWASHTLPVLAVVFDPETRTAFWADVTEHLRQHSSLIAEGPYSILVEQELSDTSFDEFRQHCLRYREQFSRELNFGRALESFATRDDVERCFDGLRALFAYHRQQIATWYYLISCISNYREHPVLRDLVVRLCHIPGHGDIFWSTGNSGNLIDEQVCQAALQFMRERFDRRDALTMLGVIDEYGIQRGTIGQCVHVLVDTMANTPAVMESIAIDSSHNEKIRHSAIFFAVSAIQAKSPEDAIAMLDRITPTVTEEELLEFISWLKEILQQFRFVPFY